jgi:hypothetical protein
MTWIEVKSATRSDEFIILRLEGPLKIVAGQYVYPQTSEGRRLTVLTDMDPRQVKELVRGLHEYARANTKLDQNIILKQQAVTTNVYTDTIPEQIENQPPPIYEEVLAEAENILQEAYASNLRREAGTNEGGYRQVPDLETFFNNPQVTLHANFGQLI